PQPLPPGGPQVLGRRGAQGPLPPPGTRFRPLSFEVPKPLFPVAGVPMIQHHIEACAQVMPPSSETLLPVLGPPFPRVLGAAPRNSPPGVGGGEVSWPGGPPAGVVTPEKSRVFGPKEGWGSPRGGRRGHRPKGVGGSYQSSFGGSGLPGFRYLQEFAPLGTGGSIFPEPDPAGVPKPSCLKDVCSDFPLGAMLEAHRRQPHPFLLLGTTANRTQSLNYGCIVENPETHEVLHYVEKPSTFVSDIINCGIYLFSPEALKPLRDVFQRNQQDRQFCLDLGDGSSGSWPGAGTIRLEQDVFTALSGQGQIYVHLTDGIWSQIKSAGSALYASRLYLNRYQVTHPERLAELAPGGPCIRGNVYIHPTAKVASSAVLGPNVSIGEGVTVGEGVRLRESIVLHGATLQEHTCVLHSIVGWGSTVGRWARVEGTPNDPNPNDPRARMDSESLFRDGKLLPAITILGCRVRIPAEVLILNSIVLPHKELSRSFTNQIIL
ncbi:mannose-1-phosphate guanyltransferase alpha, partial [Sarcophilus harrisii]|uniref:mannose-1-phosphate guanyltransferase alpha n=1 Tax=Sarcophilus harrisii TaxID=9305 RepID=UPI001301BE05